MKKNIRDRLTAKQKRYCKERAAGNTYADSYERAGYSVPPGEKGRKVATDNAYNMEHKTESTTEKIQREIKRLQEQAEAGAILDRKARQGLLSGIALDQEESTTDRLRAADMLNRMSGDYTDRVQVEATARLSYADRLEAMRNASRDA